MTHMGPEISGVVGYVLMPQTANSWWLRPFHFCKIAATLVLGCCWVCHIKHFKTDISLDVNDMILINQMDVKLINHVFPVKVDIWVLNGW